jgi:hypothetical protein
VRGAYRTPAPTWSQVNQASRAPERIDLPLQQVAIGVINDLSNFADKVEVLGAGWDYCEVLMKTRSEKRLRHQKSARRRAAKQRTLKVVRTHTPPQTAQRPMGGDDIDPVPFVDAYANSLTVFGAQMPPALLVDRIKSCDWRESFVRLSHVAAVLANDPRGPKSPRALQLGKNGLASLTAHTADAQAMLARGRRFIADAKRPIVVAHEESLVLLQHLVLLYGANGGPCPDDGELTLWLLGASDHVEAWSEPDSRTLGPIEQLAAEMVCIASAGT